MTRQVGRDRDYSSHVIVDLTRVLRMDTVAFDMLNSARRTLEEEGKTMAVVSVSAEIPLAFEQRVHFPDIDVALEHFENKLIAMGDAEAALLDVPIDQFDLLSGLSSTSIGALRACLRQQPFSIGDRLIVQEAEALDLFFLTRGRVDVVVQPESSLSHRVSTIDAGNVFGELALFGRAPRTASVIAATDGNALVLDTAGTETLRRNHPEAFTDLLVAVGGSLADRLRRANEQIGALSK